MDALSIQKESPVVYLVQQYFLDQVIRGIAQIFDEWVGYSVQNLAEDGLILIQVVYVCLLGDQHGYSDEVEETNLLSRHLICLVYELKQSHNLALVFVQILNEQQVG